MQALKRSRLTSLPHTHFGTTHLHNSHTYGLVHGKNWTDVPKTHIINFPVFMAFDTTWTEERHVSTNGWCLFCTYVKAETSPNLWWGRRKWKTHEKKVKVVFKADDGGYQKQDKEPWRKEGRKYEFKRWWRRREYEGRNSVIAEMSSYNQERNCLPHFKVSILE